MMLKMTWQGIAKRTDAWPYGFALRCNTLYGVDIDGTPVFGTQHDVLGSQKYGYFFSNYYVTASSITVDATNLNTNTDFNLSVFPSTIAVPFHAAGDNPPFPGVPYNRYAMGSIAGGSKDRLRVKNYQLFAKIGGFNRKTIDIERDWWAALNAGASPGSPTGAQCTFYWIVSVSNAANTLASGGSGIAYNIKMTFYVTLFNRRDITMT
jgi:hypothetical protein